MAELEMFMHSVAAVVSITVAILLYPLIRKSLKLKSGLVYDFGWSIMLPGIFIAIFSFIYMLNEGLHDNADYHEMVETLEIVAEIVVIMASLSILWLAWKIKSYMKKLEN